MSRKPDLRGVLEGWAKSEGFAALAITPAKLKTRAGDRLKTFVDEGMHGTMDWLARDLERRADPQTLWPDARSAIILAMPYRHDHEPLEALEQRERGALAGYTHGRDYHDVVKGALKRIAQKLVSRSQKPVKVFVDTAPVMEKTLAEQSGIGWQGKHTNLVSTELGSWFFLGEILSAHEFDFDQPSKDHCGSCSRCLEICPTQAFPSPYRLDARRCVSYLTIEHQGTIPREFRKAIGNRIFGCDDCLAVCPWNKFAAEAGDARLSIKPELHLMPLGELANLDEQAFRALFAGTAIKRTGRDRFVRNVMVAIGNSGNPALIDVLLPRLRDRSAIVRAMAVWALSQLLHPCDFVRLRENQLAHESNDLVLIEWNLGAEIGRRTEPKTN